MGSAQAKLLIEAPVNGGRNYRQLMTVHLAENDDRNCSYVNKPGYMLETPRIPAYCGDALQ